ncbi:recombination-associated protein RdgC [Cupriavidus sp. 30B13]|uniref:recombination-associated protein RdgC n=1 Tax=Cupriavidus sp. 30B13 TaxID=3384241 RepID=UPI003B9020E0
MWFKNLQLHRLSAPWTLAADEVEASLARHAFFPGTSLEMQTQGWASPRENGALVHLVGKQMLLTLRTEKKLLPTTVVNQVTKARAAEIEEQQGFKPGRKQMRELKEQVTEELLPRAFSIRRDTRVWIDPVNGWLAIDAASPAKADEVRSLLFKSIDPLPLETLQVNLSPVAAMTEWLSSDTAPAGFTVDQEIELQSSAESKATVRYVRHPLDPEDLRRHIAAGKRCTRLAMTWNDRVSFVLTESLAVKRVAPLDVIKEQADPGARDEDERFDGDFAMMAGELAGLLADLTAALGGERKTGEAAATERKAA